MSMTDQSYLDTYRKLSDKYDNNQSSMSEYLEAMKKLKENYLKDRTGAALPTVP